MDIFFSSIKKNNSFTAFNVHPGKHNGNCGSFKIISSINQKLDFGKIHKAVINNEVLLKTGNNKQLGRAIHIGNKSSNQLRLWQIGCYIPDTVVLDFNFYDTFRKNDKVDLSELYKKYIKIHFGNTIAIRCSSNLEDSEAKSYAGVFDTYLNVPNNFKAFKQKILQSYAKLNSNESKNEHFRDVNVQLGVIIQKMIQPQFTGFLFTSDPMNPPNPWIKIEYWQGAREKSERNSITLNRESGKRIRTAQDFTKILLPAEYVNKLYHSALWLHRHFGFPQDIEFVISADDQELYLVQARPITAFSYSPQKVQLKEQERLTRISSENLNLYQKIPILSSTNISELFDRAIPLGYSIFKYGFAGTKKKEGGISLGRSRLGYAKLNLTDQENFFHTVGDQARTNIIVDALTFRLPFIKKVDYLNIFVNHYLEQIQIDENAALYPENGLYVQTEKTERWCEIAGRKGNHYSIGYQKFLHHLIHHHAKNEYENAGNFFQENDDFYRTHLCHRLFSYSRSSLLKELNDILEYLRNVFCPQYVIYARIAYLCTHVSKNKLAYLLPQEKESLIDDILNSLLDSASSTVMLEEPNYPFYERLLKSGAITVVEFLDKFQHVGSLDIHQPRLGEYSIEELREIFGNHKHKDDGLPSIGHNKKNKKRKRIKALDNIAKDDEFRKWSHYAGIFMRLREKAKFDLLKILYILKRVIKMIARNQRMGDLIFYLEYDEILKLTRTNRDQLRYLALQRQAYFEACKLHKIKKVIVDLESSPFHKEEMKNRVSSDKRYSFITGKTIYFGNAEGVCLTAKTNEEYLKKLAEFRNDNISNIIGIFKCVELSYFNLSALSGFTTENGGYLAHAATIAREFKIPYITNINFDQFRDGDYVILDTENAQVIYRR